MADNPITNIRRGTTYQNKCDVWYLLQMFFTNVELFWYTFRILGNCENMAKKCFDGSSSEQENDVSVEGRN